MAFQSPSNGSPISPNQPFFGIPGQTKVSGDRQKETTHEICCLEVDFKVVTGYEEMLTFADKVGWIQKGQKHADVIYGWSPKPASPNVKVKF